MATKNNSLGVIVVLVIIIVGAIIAGIVLSNNNKTLTSADKSADKSQITANWKEFFAYSTSLSKRESLLQNGKQFSSIIESEFSALGAAKSSAKVNSITVDSSTKAAVNYTVDLNGQPALSDQTGTALQENGKWVVSDSTLCGLLALAGSKPSVCTNY